MMYNLRDMMSQRMNDERGFTLVELLLVMIVIGMLAGLGFTGFKSMQTRASRTQADVYWRDLSTAVAMYKLEKTEPLDGLKPDATDPDKTHLGAYLDVEEEPWGNAHPHTGSADYSGSHSLAYYMDLDTQGGPTEICVWVGGVESTHNDGNDCADD